MEPSTQNLSVIIIGQFPVYASAIAAICAAYAAYKSWSVSKNSFNLQKSYILNQDLIIRINSTIEKIEKLSILIMRNPLELPDEKITHGDLLIEQIKESLDLLRVAEDDKSCLSNIDNISSLMGVYENVGNNSLYLENLIIQLKRYKDTKLK